MFLGRECPEVRKSRPGQKPLSTCEFALLPAALCNSHANSYKKFDLDKSFVFQFPSDISRPSLHSPSLVQAATMVAVVLCGGEGSGTRDEGKTSCSCWSPPWMFTQRSSILLMGLKPSGREDFATWEAVSDFLSCSEGISPLFPIPEESECCSWGEGVVLKWWTSLLPSPGFSTWWPINACWRNGEKERIWGSQRLSLPPFCPLRQFLLFFLPPHEQTRGLYGNWVH